MRKRIAIAFLAVSVLACQNAFISMAEAAEAEPSVEWNIPQTMKIGEYVPEELAYGTNLPFSESYPNLTTITMPYCEDAGIFGRKGYTARALALRRLKAMERA